LEISWLDFDQVTPSIQTAQILVPWFQTKVIPTSEPVRYALAKMLPYVRERDEDWIALAGDVFGMSTRQTS
jgi:hypothetical protein